MAKTKLTQSGAQVQSDLNFTERAFPIYNENHTYEQDSIVRHDDKLYVCVANSTRGAWNSQYWREVTINQVSPTRWHIAGFEDDLDDEFVSKMKQGDLVDDTDWYGILLFKDNNNLTFLVTPYDEVGSFYYYVYQKDGNTWYFQEQTVKTIPEGSTMFYEHYIKFSCYNPITSGDSRVEIKIISTRQNPYTINSLDIDSEWVATKYFWLDDIQDGKTYLITALCGFEKDGNGYLVKATACCLNDGTSHAFDGENFQEISNFSDTVTPL